MSRVVASLDEAISARTADISVDVRDGRVIFPATPTMERDVIKYSCDIARIQSRNLEIVHRTDGPIT
jgi:hypothetical protein